MGWRRDVVSTKPWVVGRVLLTTGIPRPASPEPAGRKQILFFSDSAQRAVGGLAVTSRDDSVEEKKLISVPRFEKFCVVLVGWAGGIVWV